MRATSMMLKSKFQKSRVVLCCDAEGAWEEFYLSCSYKYELVKMACIQNESAVLSSLLAKIKY